MSLDFIRKQINIARQSSVDGHPFTELYLAGRYYSTKKSSDQIEHNRSWIINCFSKLSSNIKYITSVPMRVDFLNHSLNILADDVNEFIYLTPETYVLQSTLHLGILSFDSCHHGKWVLSFNDEPSALDFIKTLRKNDIKVTDIQKLLSERMHMENAIIKTVTDVSFPNFVAEVEYIIKNKNI